MHLKLIDDWRRAHRLWSVRLSAGGAFVLALVNAFPSLLTVTATWLSIPDDLRSVVPGWVTVGVLLSIATARIVQQKKSDDE